MSEPAGTEQVVRVSVPTAMDLLGSPNHTPDRGPMVTSHGPIAASADPGSHAHNSLLLRLQCLLLRLSPCMA